MKRWADVKGNVVSIIVHQDDMPTIDGVWVDVTGKFINPGDLYDNGVFLPPLPTLVITKVAMISRFTPQEYVGIVGATKTDVEVQAWYDLFQAATVVDLQDQRTIAGIESLVSKNLLTQPRATEILTTPAQPNEIPA